MPPSAQSTALQKGSANLDRGNSVARPSAAALVLRVDETIRWTFAGGTPGLVPNAAPRRALTDHEQGRTRDIDPPPVSPHPAPAASLHAMQEWEGYVLEIGATEFVARLVDVTTGASHEGEEAVIPRTELSDGDDSKMRVGSIFRWVIGYERSPAGTKKRVSQIVFRDLPAITASDLQTGRDWGRKMARSLNP